MMRKLLLAALAIILAFPALAQTATTPAEPAPPPVTPPAEPPPPPPKAPAPLFTIYGTVNANLQLAEAGGATTATAKVKSRTAVSIDSSNLGVRGTYDLPLPLQVVFQCETGASLDGIGGAVLCNRNSRVGLQSAVAGTLFFGNWDTPFKSVAYGTKADDPFLNTDVWGFNGIIGSPGFNYRSGGWSTAADTSTVGFDVRANNSVAWHSPSWAGLSLKAQYSADEFKNASGTQDPTLYSVNAVYDNRYLSVGVAFEQHQDGFALVGLNPIKGGTPSDPASKNATFGATAGNTAGSAATAIHSTDTAWRVAAGGQLPWAAGTTTLSAMVDQLTLDQSDAPAGALKEYQRLAWQVGLKHRVGDHELRVRYSTADKGKCKLAGGADCSAKDYGATFLALGYAYYAAKNTQLYVHYAMLQNEKKAQYTFPIGGSPAVAGSTPAGADPTAIGLGIRYGF